MVNRQTWQPDPVGKLSSKTNVWGIGAIVISLMNKMVVLQGTSFMDGESQPEIKAHAEKKYSKPLLELVGECTRYWPDDRPGLRTLRRRVRKAMEYGQSGDLGRAMRGEIEEGDGDLWMKYHRDDPARVGRWAQDALEAMEK